MSKEVFVEEIVNRLCEEYNVPRNFEIHTGFVARKYMSARDLKGFYGEGRSKRIMGINFDKVDTPKEIRATVMHEFRHVWQYTYYHDLTEYWSNWTRKHGEDFGKDAYLFSPIELDANRFAKSDGTLDDDSVLIAVPASQYPAREFGELVYLAGKIASRSVELVRPEVLVYLQERGFLAK